MKCLKASISIIDKSLPEVCVRLLDLIYIAEVIDCLLYTSLGTRHKGVEQIVDEGLLSSNIDALLAPVDIYDNDLPLLLSLIHIL